MITLITGLPGAGKSAALVYLLLKLSQGRALYVNGIPELGVPHIAWTDEEAHRWDSIAEDGAAVVIDEVQRLWPPSKGNKAADIAALEVHRHSGLDFYLVTQHPKLLHLNVRTLVGRHIHLRDVGIYGRWWYEWPECSEALAWKTAPISKRYKLPKKAFTLYKSASLHVKPLRGIPKGPIVIAACLAAGGFLATRVYGRVSEVTAPAVIAAAVAASSPGRAAPPTSVPASGAVPRNEAQSPVAASAPVVQVLGCIATASRCGCINESGGIAFDIPDAACRASARHSGGYVPYAVASKPSGPASAPQRGLPPVLPTVYGLRPQPPDHRSELTGGRF